MARIRNFLIDNTIGKVFTNVQNVSSANASNLIAGSKLQSKSFTTPSKTADVLVDPTILDPSSAYQVS